ncbi:hypothetical protein [Micromonospora marina]|uniref:hypothetical protein n=1 Tax=Micromonospora marina TaxID=307120 RepID=UPI0034537368
MTATATLPDAGLCRWCPHPQWSHKRGKGGCRELDCVCDKYEVDPAVQRAEKERVLTAVVDVCEEQADKARTELAGLRGDLAAVEAEPEPVDEPKPEPEPVPVVVDPAAQAEHAEQVAAIDEQLAQPEPEQVEDDELPDWGGPENEWWRGEHQRLSASIERLTTDRDRLAGQLGARLRELDDAQTRIERQRHDLRIVAAERSEAQATVERLTTELAEERERTRDAEHAAKTAREAVVDLRRALAEQQQNTVDVPQLRADLEQAIADRQRVQQQYDDAVRNGLAAALRVLWQYPARQCLTDGCGFRTTVPDLDHEHPLTAVAVIVAERDPAEATAFAVPSSKEQ